MTPLLISIFFITLLLCALSSFLTYLFTLRHLKNKIPLGVCPFNNACTIYSDIHTKAAIKRILTLMIENKVPKEEIQTTINKEFGS